MPLFPRKKSGKQNSKSVKRQSQFFDDAPPSDIASVPASEINSTDQHKPCNGEKRRSKSKFYEDLPVVVPNNDSLDTASIGSDHSHASSTSKTSQPPLPKILAIETQGDLGQSQRRDVWCRRTSVLSRSFSDMLHDQDLIGQFILYMTSKDRGHLVKFWLESENFAEGSLGRIRVHSIQSAVDSETTAGSTQPPQTTDSKLSLQDNNSNNTSIAKSEHRRQTDNDLQERIKTDAVNIYSKYIALDCQHPIGITEELRNATISRICSEDGKVDPLCFKECQKFIEDILEKMYFKDFLDSPYYRRYQLQLLVDNKLHLIDILYNDNIMFYFLEFVEQENASALLQFWMAVDNFQSQLESDKYTAAEAQSDAMILYEKYFSLQASEPLGFTDKVRMHVELNICREGGPLPDCFFIPKIIILETIEKTLFRPFLQSQVYYRYLSELIGSNQAADHHVSTPKSQPKKSHHRKGSTDSSHDTQSLGGRSLPDNDISDIHRQSRLPGIDDDGTQWKKGHPRKAMSLGHLSEFGQYISELDLEQVPDLDKHKGGRFSRKKREKERAQEAMAWEVTKMIVAGIKQEVSSNHVTVPKIIEPKDEAVEPPGDSSQVTKL